MNLVKSFCLHLGSTVIWSYYMLSPEPERITEQARSQTERWNFALADARSPEYNFLPMIESVVERVLSNRHIDVDHQSEK